VDCGWNGDGGREAAVTTAGSGITAPSRSMRAGDDGEGHDGGSRNDGRVSEEMSSTNDACFHPKFSTRTYVFILIVA
jgi:hypothetical protein